MRTRNVFLCCSLVGTIAAIVAISACTPYDPTLPAVPFSCGSSDPKCPDGYTCTTDETNGTNVCMAMPGTDVVDASTSACTADAAEPNDTLGTATALPSPLPQNPFTFADLSICPATDKDYYSFTVTDQQNIDITMTYVAGGAMLTMTVLNSTGSPIVDCSEAPSSCPTTSTTQAITASNLAAGEYYVNVVGPGTTTGAGSGTNNYQLSFNITD